MLDENGRRDIARKVALCPKNLDLLKVLYDRFLREGGRGGKGEHALDCSTCVTMVLTCAASLAIFVM